MSTFYTGVDQQRYDEGEKFLPQNRFLLNYTPPKTNVEEEEVTTSYGIPNTNAFVNSGGGNNVGHFDPYTAQTSRKHWTPAGTLSMGPQERGHWSYRTDIGNTGYMRGYEPEETNMNKIGALVKKGIGMAIPGGNFLMGLAENQSREKRLNAADNAFIDMQLGIDEENIHGFGNLDNQDRYGYNKESLFGNYADKVKERVEIAKKREAEGKDLRDIDNYYLEKQKELDETNEIIDYNNKMRTKSIVEKINAGAFKNPDGTDIYDGANIHGGGDGTTTITNTDQSGVGDGYTGSGDFSNIDNSGKDYGPHSKSAGSTQHGSSGMTKDQHAAFRAATGGRVGFFAHGGRVYLNLGGLASIL